MDAMKPLFLLAVLLAAPALADDAADLKALDTSWAEATLKSDAAALGRIFADDLRYVHGSGTVENKQQFLASLKGGGMKYHSIDMEELAVRVLGDTAVVTSTPHIRIFIDGKDQDFRARFLRVYLKRSGRWQLTYHQATRIP
jgi:uncharacterized protein (TIGR02246 family)